MPNDEFLIRSVNMKQLANDFDWQEVASAPSPDAPGQTMPQNAPECPQIGPPSPTPRAPAQQLSAKQLAAVELLVQGWEDSMIARRLQIDRKTLYRWKFKNPLFKSHLHLRREETWSTASDRFRRLLLTSANVLEEQLEHGSNTDAYRAAYALSNSPPASNPAAKSGPPNNRPRTTNYELPASDQ